MRPCDENLRRTFEVVALMLKVSDEGDAVREDTGCGVLYAVLRDAAFKVKKLADAERLAHIRKGWWK